MSDWSRKTPTVVPILVSNQSLHHSQTRTRTVAGPLHKHLARSCQSACCHSATMEATSPHMQSLLTYDSFGDAEGTDSANSSDTGIAAAGDTFCTPGRGGATPNEVKPTRSRAHLATTSNGSSNHRKRAAPPHRRRTRRAGNERHMESRGGWLRAQTNEVCWLLGL